MSGAHWSGPRLFMGRVMIGRIEPNLEAGKSGPDPVAGFSYLPGAPHMIGRFANEAKAQEMVEISANSRFKAMFDVDLARADHEIRHGRELRKVGRAIWRAGVRTCDRPAYAFEMFRDLARALDLDPASAPKSGDAQLGKTSSSAVPAPEDVDLVD
jgi:hypothetical protein